MTNPLYGRRDEMLDAFLLRPEPLTHPSAILRVADLYSGGPITRAIERESLALVYRHDPNDTTRPDFDTIPDFEILTVTLPPAEPPDDALVEARDRVLRFLRVRRPWVFILIGGDEPPPSFREWTDALGYWLNRVHGRATIGTLGRDLPNQAKGDSLVMRLVRACVE